MEDKRQLFFIAIFKEEIDKISIEMNRIDCNYFYLDKKESKYYYIIRINEIPSPNKDENIELNLKFYKSIKEEYNVDNENTTLIDKNIVNLLLKFNQNKNQKKIKFLFDYSLANPFNLNLIKNIQDWFLNWNFSFSEKFLLYYEYLLIDTNNFEDKIVYYLSLINDFINEKIKMENSEKLTLEIIISILIVSSYDNNFELFNILKLNKDSINFKDIRENNLIKKYDKLYLNQINKCIEEIKAKNYSNKNLILEIIMIYYIKFKNINILFSEEKNREMVMNFLKENDNNLILGEILDEEINNFL